MYVAFSIQCYNFRTIENIISDVFASHREQPRKEMYVIPFEILVNAIKTIVTFHTAELEYHAENFDEYASTLVNDIPIVPADTEIHLATLEPEIDDPKPKSRIKFDKDDTEVVHGIEKVELGLVSYEISYFGTKQLMWFRMNDIANLFGLAKHTNTLFQIEAQHKCKYTHLRVSHGFSCLHSAKGGYNVYCNEIGLIDSLKSSSKPKSVQVLKWLDGFLDKIKL